MRREVRVILLDEADEEYKELNKIIGQQIKEGKEHTKEIQLLKSIKQKRDLTRKFTSQINFLVFINYFTIYKLLKIIHFMETIFLKNKFQKHIMYKIYGE